MLDSLILAFILIILGIVIFRLLSGTLKFVVSFGLFFLAAVIFLYIFLGLDPTGLGTTTAAVVDQIVN